MLMCRSVDVQGYKVKPKKLR